MAFTRHQAVGSRRRLEPDAIAAVVLGGSLLTGGVGLVGGDLFGGVIEEMIQTLISQTLTSFNGSLRFFMRGSLVVSIVTQRSVMSSFAFRRAS
jgi:galactofuranose transport system permease protein